MKQRRSQRSWYSNTKSRHISRTWRGIHAQRHTIAGMGMEPSERHETVSTFTYTLAAWSDRSITLVALFMDAGSVAGFKRKRLSNVISFSGVRLCCRCLCARINAHGGMQGLDEPPPPNQVSRMPGKACCIITNIPELKQINIKIPGLDAGA